MSDHHPLYKITDADRALALEFKCNMEGPHRPDVLRLLNRIFWTPIKGRIVLVCIRNHREWCLGRLSGVRGEPIEVLRKTVYTDRNAAFWAAFEMRWQSISGQSLEI
jgi:hypothetical protein